MRCNQRLFIYIFDEETLLIIGIIIRVSVYVQLIYRTTVSYNIIIIVMLIVIYSHQKINLGLHQTVGRIEPLVLFCIFGPKQRKMLGHHIYFYIIIYQLFEKDVHESFTVL